MQHRCFSSGYIQKYIDVRLYAFGCVEKNFTFSTDSGYDYLDLNFQPLSITSLQALPSHKYLIDVDGNGYSGEQWSPSRAYCLNLTLNGKYFSTISNISIIQLSSHQGDDVRRVARL